MPSEVGEDHIHQADLIKLVKHTQHPSVSVAHWRCDSFLAHINLAAPLSRSSTFTSNKRAARELAPSKRPTRSAIFNGDCFLFSQLAWIFFKPSSMRDSDRAKMARSRNEMWQFFNDMLLGLPGRM